MRAPREQHGRKGTDRLTDRVRSREQELTPALARVVAYIDRNRLEILTKSAVEIGAAIGTSDATVIRAVQALGFEGLRELKAAVATTLGQGASPADNMARSLAEIDTERQGAIDQVLRAHQDAIATMGSSRARADIEAAVGLLDRAQCIAVFGIGPTAFVAGYFAMMIGRTGRTTIVLNASGPALADQLLQLHGAQAMLVLAYGRAYREVTTAIEEARRLKLRVVLVTDTIDQDMAEHTHAVVHVPRGRAGHVALHGATVVCLESIMLGLAAAKPDRTVATLERLNDLRKELGRKRR